LTIELTLAQQSDLHLRYRVRKLKQLVSVYSPAFGYFPFGSYVHSLIILKTLN
jgi:hypothetical protein